MANLVLQNNSSTTKTEVTLKVNTKSSWKIINNAGSYVLNGKDVNLFTMTDAGVTDFVNKVTLTTNDTNNAKFIATNANGSISLWTSTNRGIYDETAKKWLIYTDVDSTNADARTPSNFVVDKNLTVTGTSTLIGTVYIKSGASAIATLAGPTTAGTFTFPNTGGTFVTHPTRGTAVGSDAQPVYIASTGRATAVSGINTANYLLNALGTGSSTPVDADYYISQYVGGGTTTTTYHRRPMSALWTYIKGKMNVDGNAASATKLATARTLTVGNTGKTFNGTANVSWSANEIGCLSLVQRGSEFADAANLNTIGYGNYYSNNSTKSATLSNGPVTGSGFRLFHQRGYNGTEGIYDWQFAFTSSRTIYQRYRNGDGAWGDWGTFIIKHESGAVGSATTPIYINANGAALACSAYAGGTAVTLNGTSKAASTASFYAPTGAGTSGYILKSNGSGAPSWAAVSNSEPTLAWGTTSTVGTVAGTALKVKMPANPNTDSKVQQARSTAANYRAVLMHATNTSYGTDPGTATAETYYNEAVAINPSNGTLRATNVYAGKFAINVKNSGYYLTDSTGTSYPGVYDNGSNLWVGSIQSSAKHHVGATYISAGYDGSAGNTSIYIAVPNASNSGSTNYLAFHRGYLNVGDATHGTLAIARGGTGMTSNPSLLVNLGSTSAASVFAASPRPGITGTLSVAHGGTGHSSWTANRIVWSNGTDSLTAGNHYADADHIHINGTAAPDTAFKVTGAAFITSFMNCGALFVGKNKDAAGHSYTGWGTAKPAGNVTEGIGRVYFQVI